ncbi:hypothetical protein TWF718_008836 [Orbilia javanica]|uniref:Chromo domain-containing protein n=1 Tax=Orbilia javanica TaxID=47235 RepID=A0AAN8MTV5_9PEZI
MARKAAVPQSQAPYRPSRASTATNTEPHNLRDKSPVGYKNVSDTEKESPQATQSSEGDGLWWEVRRITAERRRKGKKEYRVEWEGINKDTGEPWPQEWKLFHCVTSALVEEWEARKARKKRGRASSSPSPVSQVPARVSEPVRIPKEDIERYRRARKRQKTTNQDPIIISSSSEEEGGEGLEGEYDEETATEIQPLDKVSGHGTMEEPNMEVGETSEDDIGPLMNRPHRRRIVESSQSGGKLSQTDAGDEVSQPLSEELVAVEIPIRHDLDSSLYSSFHEPSSRLGAKDRERGQSQAHPSISSLEEDPDDRDQPEEFGTMTLLGRLDEVHIQVARTQSSGKEKREIPDSQSSGATPIVLTPIDQRPVPETPLHRLATALPSPAEQLLPAQSMAAAGAAPRLSTPQPSFEDVFEDIPDSSNRVFSQDVRELRAQSQSSKESQGSRASLPSAQLSLGKVGVTPSFQSFTDSEEAKTFSAEDEKEDREVSNLQLQLTPGDAPRPGALVGKSVAGEASSFARPNPSPNRPSSQTPPANLEPLTATNIPRRTQQSASTPDKDSFVTPTSFPEGSIDDALELATAPEHPFEPLASRRLNTIRILQAAVESRPEDIVDPDLEPRIQPAQLEHSPSHDQGQGEAAGLSNSPQLRNLESCEPLPVGLDREVLNPSPGISSPGIPAQEEDPLQGGRSASSTPCGPIPASARPTPVTVLGYLQSRRPINKTPEGNEESSPGSAASGELQGKPIPSPPVTLRSDEQGRSNTLPSKGAMSAGPISPLLNVVDIAVAPEHRLSPQRQVIPTSPSGLLPTSSSSEPLISYQSVQTYATPGPEPASARERTPGPGDQPIIDDEHLAASQALRLLQGTPRSALNEVFLAIPLTKNQHDIYQETIVERYRDVKAFYGINNTQNQSGDVSLAMIESIICDLDLISSHSELSSDGPSYTSKEEGPKLVRWFRKQSSKFDFLFRLLKGLRDQPYSVALVLEAGMLMDYADIFFRSAGYQFTRFSGENGAEVITPTPEAQTLRLFLVPSRDMVTGASMPTVNLIIAVDSSLDSSSTHIQQLRNIDPTAQAPILHLVPINTVAHIRQYLPDSPSTPARDIIGDYLNPVLYAAILLRHRAGILPLDLQNRLDALTSSVSIIDWLEELRTTGSSLLPPLPLKSPQSTQRGAPGSQSAAPSTSPARKRILSQSATPSTTGAKHKRARIETEQKSPESSGDIPMLDPDDALAEPGDVTEAPAIKESGGDLETADISGEITHVTGTIPTERAKLTGEPSVPSETFHKDVVTTPSQRPVLGTSEKEGNEPNEYEETEEEMLSRLSKDEVVYLLLEYQDALWRNKLQSDEFERNIQEREDEYQNQREKVLHLKKTIQSQESQIEALTEQRDKSQAIADQAIRERDHARDGLKRFQEALQDSESGESERAKIILENTELNSRINSLESKRQSTTRELEFIRDQYQRASRGTSQLMSEKNQLEEKVEDLARKADSVKVQLKNANMDHERKKYQNKIQDLTARLDRANKQIVSLEVEKKRVERTRGVQTRSSSIPPRGAQSSPVPTRPGSPSTTTYRSLRNSEGA